MKDNPRTKAVWEFIVKFKLRNDGRTPTLRDIVGQPLGTGIKPITSTSTLNFYKDKLIRAGLLTKEKTKARGTDVVGGRYHFPVNLFDFDPEKYTHIVSDLRATAVYAPKMGHDGIYLFDNNFLGKMEIMRERVPTDKILVIPESDQLYFAAVAFGLDILPFELVEVFL